MKKTICFLLGTAILSLGTMTARTWTSADGTKTFKGELKSYNEETGVVKVVKGFREISFTVDKLSKADQEWLKTQTSKGKAEAEAKKKAEEAASKLDDQKIGSKIKEGVLSKLEGDAFVDYKMSTAPEYYVVYYSGSW